MEKRLQLILLFCAFQFATTPILRADESIPLENHYLKTDQCDAPAPDSFRVISHGPNFIDLSWIQAWDGASHTLSIFTKNTIGEWIHFGTFDNITGTSYTVNNIAFDADCKFLLSTNCNAGEPSFHKAVLYDKTILEVVVGGRTPFKPTAVQCQDISLLEHEWVGFEVTGVERGESATNLFELERTSSGGTTRIKIKRVIYNNPIVAVDLLNHWPTTFEPELKADNPFLMDRIVANNALNEIGRVDFILNSARNSIYLCLANTIPAWNNSYTFTTLVADEVIGFTPLPSSNRNDIPKSSLKQPNLGKFKAQSPFNETLNLFTDHAIDTEEKIALKLLSPSGQTVLEQNIEGHHDQLSIPVGTISPGVYILRIETTSDIQMLKVIKVE